MARIFKTGTSISWLEYVKNIFNPVLLFIFNRFYDVELLDGFEYKLELKARDLGKNSEYFRKSDKLLTFGDEPPNRISTWCPKVYGTAPYVAIINDVYLLGLNHPIAITSNFKIIFDSIDNVNLFFMGRMKSILENGIDIKSKLTLLLKSKFLLHNSKNQVLDEAVLLTNNWTHFGHWILEHLIKIRYIQEFKRYNTCNPVFILEKNAPQWQYDLLSLIDIGEKRIICWDGKPIKAKRLILPSYPEWNFDDYSWLKSKILNSIPGLESTYSTRIYLSRKNCSTRIVENEQELTSVFDKHNIQVLYPEELPLFDQIAIFSKATLVMGPNGSAFSNIIFSSNPAIIEFHGLEIRRTAYKLSKVMGFDYYPFYSELNTDTTHSNSDKYLYIDPVKLDSLLLKILE